MSDDLQRFLDGRPLEARRSRVLERLGRWCARNPLIATLGVLVLLLLVTVAILSSFYAVRLRGEHTVGQRKLRSAYLAEASALRASARPGRRFEALEALRRAAAIEPGSDLVDEALACLALVDLRLLKTWSKERDESLFGAPDGTTLALVRPGGEIVLRSAADGREGFRLPPPEFRASFSSGRFSPDGRHLAVRREGDGRCEWEIWDLDRRLVCAQMKDAYAENCIAFAPDGRWVALGTGERALRLLDLETGAPIGEDVGRGWGAHKAAVHPAGRLIAFSSDRRARVHVYDREWGEVIRTLSGTREQRFEQVAWHPDGRTLAAASRDHMVYLWNAETGEPARLLQGHWAEVIDVSFHPRRALLVSRDWSPTVRFWEPGSDRPVFTIHQREGYFAGDQRCFTERYDGVDCWELTPAPRAFTLFGHSLVGRDATIAKHPHAVALAPGGRLAASGGDDGVRLWDLAARREAAHLDVGRVESVFFDASGGSLYASGEGGLQRWPVRAIGDGRTRIALGPSERLSQRAGWQRAALSHDGRKLAAVHERRRPYIFDAADPERATALSGPPHHDLSIALSADGAWAAAGTFGNWPGPEVWLWDLRHAGHEGTGGGALEPVRELHAPRAEISFHPASTHLATCTPIDCTLWRLSDGEPAWRIERERGMTFPGQVAFDRGGTFAAVSYNESTVWLVEAASGRKLGELAAPEPMKLSALALEGGKLVAATSGRRIHVWDLNGLQREIAGLGLSWAVPLPGEELEDLPPLRVAVADGSTDLLLDAAPDLGGRQLFRPMDEGAFLPELVSCAQIDRALAAPRCLIGEGEKWTYFRGVAEPSPALEWTLVDHDDTHWARGRSPLSAWPPSAGARATFLADQEGFFTTLYARCAFDVDEPAKLGALALAVEVEDGFVAYLNGEEVGRAMAGLPGERLGFRAVAPRSARRRWTEPVAIPPSRVRAGRNVLAIQVLSYGLDSRLHLLPVLAAVPAADVEGDRRRTANLAAGADGRPDASLLAYREGRILERAGRTAAALEAFERASALDRGSVEPLLRRLACHRALGEPEVAEALAREAIEAGSIAEPARLWRAWHHAAMVDLALSPARAVALLPREPAASRPRLSSHYRALLEGLAARGSIRINAGGGDVETGDGRRWSSDRFFLSGHSHDLRRSSRRLGERPGVAAETPEDSERWFPGTETFRRGYSIPLPPGRYHVTLHLRERTQDNRAERVFDVLLEGRLVPANGDCGHRGGGELGASPRVHCADWTVADGTLDLDFLAHSCNPGVCAIEIEMDGATEGLSSR
jgi:WD40 repeat protein